VEDSDHGESKKERISRELIELLNELRVALPGVQVLFAFLLAVPFSNGFSSATDTQKNIFFVTLGLTTIASVLLIAPSSYHRINFRARDKERLLFTANRWSIAGLFFLALAMVSAVVLIADYVYSRNMAIVSGIVAGVIFGFFWFAVPLARYRENIREKNIDEDR
jgi:Flp pilus assembly protein TadB